MSLWSPAVLDIGTITPWSLESIGSALTMQGGTVLTSAATAAYPAANDAIFVPFWLSQPILVKKLFLNTGATSSGNVDVGIYDEKLTKLVSAGSTLMGSANVLQEFDIADTLIGPGLFYLAIAVDNTTGTLIKGQAADVGRLRALGVAKMATAFPLPATATLAAVTADYIPLFGLTTKTVI